MAEFFPDVARTRVVFASKAEQYFYECCKRLSKSWKVIYSCTLSTIENNKGLQDNEMDFVLYHPRYGLVVIEVKGGGIEYDAQKEKFYSVNRFGSRFSIKNPFQQVLTWKSRCIRYLKDHQIKLPISHIVCFPSVAREQIPHSAAIEHDILLCREDMEQLEVSLKNVVKKSQPEKYLNFKDCGDRLCELLVGRDFSTKNYLYDYMSHHEDKLRGIEQIQDGFIMPLIASRKLGVEGEAGTGKTLLSIKLAKHFNAQKSKVLLLSSNRLLTDWLRQQLPDTIDVFSYIEWGLQYNVDLLKAPGQFSGKNEDWVQIEAPEQLIKSVKDTKNYYDVVICDEAQDVQPFWWDSIEALHDPAKSESRMYVFFDRSQGVFGSGGENQSFVPEDILPVKAPYFPLVNNYRTTLEISSFAREFRVGQNILPSHSARIGYLPQIICYENEADAKRKLEQLAQYLTQEEGLKPSQVTLLSARRPFEKPSVLQGMQSLAGQALQKLSSGRSYVKSQMDLTKEDQFKVATVGSFKGLESDVAVLINFSEYNMPVSNPLMKSLIYVAATRAKHMLYIFLRKDDKRKLRDFQTALKRANFQGALTIDSHNLDFEMSGEVSYFNPLRFGVIQTKEELLQSTRIFFYPQDILAAGLRDIEVGQRLLFHVKKEQDVLVACDLKLA